MLTEHEQLADHEARISRQELPPLQQPLDNIEQIRQALSNEWQPFETAPEGVPLLWHLPFVRREYKYQVMSKRGLSNIYWQSYKCQWRPDLPPPKDENV